MKVTVKDCLELPVFEQSVVKAGMQGMDNRVNAISFLVENTEDDVYTTWYKEDEIILSTCFYNRNEDEQKQILQELSDSGEAALVLFPTKVHSSEISNGASALSDELGFPVISISNDAMITYADVIDEVMEKVHYGDNFGNRLISNTIFHLLNFEKHSNFQSAAREAAINNNFQMVILSEDFNPIFSVETRAQNGTSRGSDPGRYRT